MKKSYKKSERRGLPGGPNETFTYVTGVFSTEGYKKDSPDVNNPFNIIDSGSITMEDVEFPVMGIDNLGNSQMMMPGGDYQFPGDMVFELPMAQRGMFDFDFSADGVKNFTDNYKKILTGTAETVFGPAADQINRGSRLLSSYSPGMVFNYKNYEDGDYLPVFNKAKDKDEAFAQARADLGPGKRFIYDGVRYTTDYYGETEDEQTKIALDRIKNYLKDTPGGYDRFIEEWNKSGQPNFRGMAPDEPLFDLSKYGAQGPSLESITEGRPFFNSFAPTNTIYFGEDFDDLSDRKIFEYAVKEIPHGQQWNKEGTFSFNTKIGKQILENLPKDKPLSALTKRDFDRAQSDTYYTEGHLEHEAHKIMEEDITDYILGKKERGGGLTRQLRNFEYDKKRNKRFAQEGGGVNEEGVKQYAFLKEYMNSPMYAERLKIEFPDYSDEQIAEEAKTRLQNVMQTRVGFLPESSKYSESRGDVQGFVDPENFPDMMMLRPEYSALTPDNPPYAYNTTPIHEWQHVADEVGNRMPQSTKDLISSSTKDNVLNLPKEDYYYTKPTEIVARIQELRYLLDDQGIYDAKKDKFTQQDLDKAKKNDRIKYNARFQDLMDNIKSDEALIELMNSVAAIDTMEQDDTMMAQGGIEIPKRIGVRKNVDGSESTHLMKAEQLEDGTWVAFPSLFQNEDGKWIDMSGEKDWMKIYNEALKRGEVINFGDDKESAIKFGEGSWKKMEKGGSVSWQWKGKTYSGTLIPSMENEKNRYARTENGKIKTLPKAQLGLFDKMGAFDKIKKNLADGFNANRGYTGLTRDGMYGDDSLPAILRRLFYVGVLGGVEPDVSTEIDWDSKEGNSDDTYINDKLAEANKNLEQNLFRLYLDQDQVGKYQLSESQYRPSKGDNKADKYLSIPKEYQDNVYGPNQFPTIIDIQEYEGLPNKDIVNALSPKYNKVIDRDMVVGDYTRGIGLNEDDNIYLSAYDKFDLNPFPSQVGDMSMGIGKPQDIYDRFNYVRVNADTYPEFTFLKDADGSSSYSDALVREDNLEDYLELQREKQKRYDRGIKQTGGDIDLSGEEQKDFLKEWLYSPMGQQMLSNSFKGNQKLIDDRTFKRDTFLDDVDIEIGTGDFSGRYNRGPHRIQMNEDYLDRFGHLLGKEPKDVLLHELSHAQDFGGKYGGMNKLNMPLSDVKFIENLTKSSIKDKKNYDLSRDEIKDLRYYGSPTEVRARLNAIRYFYETDSAGGKNDKGLPSIFNSPVTPEMQESMKRSDQYRDLQKVYTDDEILQLLNTISYQESDFNQEADKFIYARYGTELPKAQRGLLRNLLKKAGPKIIRYIDDLMGKTDDVVKAAPAATKQKALYQMLPVKKLPYPTHYGTTNTPTDDVIVNALDMLKAQGKYADEVGFQIKDLVGENIQYLGNQGGRTIVNVPLPDGKSQMFYKSTDLAGKGTEGLWQPYAGHATILDWPGRGKVENWFIKDIGFENWYDSKSFRDIAGNLDRIAAEQGWDMSKQILKSKLKNDPWMRQFGGPLPKAQRGILTKLIKKGSQELDNVLKRFSKDADNFEFKTLPGIESKQFIRVVDGQFDEIDYKHLIPTQQEISDIATKTRKRLLTDKFIKNNMEATGRSKDEILGYIDNYIKEFETSVIDFNKLDDTAGGLYTKGKITIDPRNPYLTKDNVLGTLEHEIEHMFSSASRQGSDLYRHPVFKVAGTEGASKYNKLMKNISQPFEQQVRLRKALGWLEKNAGLKPGGNVTDEQVKKLTDAITNWSKESGKDFAGKGAYADVQHLFGNLDARQFLGEGQYLIPGAKETANITQPNVRKVIKDILNKTYATIPIGIGLSMEGFEDGYLPEQQLGGEEGEFQLPFTQEDWEYYRTQFKPPAYPPPFIYPTPEPTMPAQSTSGITPNLLFTQAYVESRLDPSIKNNLGYMGLGQIGKDVIEDYKKANKVSELDPFNPQDNYNVQNWYMNRIYNSEWVDKPNQLDEVRLAKTLAGYSLGPKKARGYFTKFREDGKDIYNSFEWLDDLPDETSKYIKMILKGENTEKRPRVQENIQDALTNDKYKLIRDLYFNSNIKRLGGESKILKTYEDYINGKVSDERSEKVYDKLNRIHLKDAKEKGMSVPNYIMTYLAGNS